MALNPGSRLGPYEIHSALGAGGMGEVYRARDTRLDRTVALKVLPARFSADPQRRQRFEREARAVSSLNHPNICTVYDVGEQDGLHFLVMEYLEGESLSARLARGSLPVERVLRHGVELADALDKAHRHGIVHRDLKPGNVMLTKTGAKLLDFGLAKLRDIEGRAVGGLSAAATAATPLTAAGALVGTLPYMAPEQLQGAEPDARTDIFALGAVTYEMATGRRPFRGESAASLIAAIMSSEPLPISTVFPSVPPALERVVKKCLAKDPDERWQSALDLRDELRWIAEEAAEPAPATGRKRHGRLAWALASSLLAIVALVLGVGYFLRSPPEVRTIRSSILPPEGTAFDFGGPRAGPVTVSPDGRRLAFVASTPDGKRLVWVHYLDSGTAQPVAGTEGAFYPFWSPDGASLGFFADKKLQRVAASGGSRIVLCEAPEGRGGTWSRDGIVFAPDLVGPLYRVSASGGASSPVTSVDQAQIRRKGATAAGTSHRSPYFLPDGHRFLYLEVNIDLAIISYTAKGTIRVGSLDSHDSRSLFEADSAAVYASGYLLFVRKGTLMAQPFDPGRAVTSGEPMLLSDRIQTYAGRGIFSASDDGILVYQTSSGTPGRRLIWRDREGKQLEVLGEPAGYLGLELSRDGIWAAVVVADSEVRGADIWLFELARGLRTLFTSDPAFERSPVWSPDGSQIVFTSNRKGKFDIYRKASSGAGGEEPVFTSDTHKYATSWSRDGQLLLFDDEKGDIWALPMSGDRKPFSVVHTEFVERDGQFSPNGHWVAYRSNESGDFQVYVTPFPGPGRRQLISRSGGRLPRWRRDGKELYYVARDGKLMVAEIRNAGPNIEAGASRPLFDLLPGAVTLWGSFLAYDVSPDGRRFLVQSMEESRPSPITLVTNWTAELKR